MEKPNYRDASCCYNCKYSFRGRYEDNYSCNVTNSYFAAKKAGIKEENAWFWDHVINDHFVCDLFELE